MAGLLSRLFSSTDVVASTIKSATKGLDSLVYTDQERAEKTEVAQKIYQKMWMAALPSALSRRLIACTMVAVWAILIVTGVAEYAAGWKDAADYTFGVLKEVVLQPVNIIVSFYFLKQVVAEYRNKT